MPQSQSHRRPGRPKTESPNPIDVCVGARVRLRRNMLGLTQEQLGEAIGLTFQQVQKYERGANRIGASRLHELSRVLDVPISFFFDDTDPVRAPATGGFAEPPAETFEADPLRKQETIELVRAYFSIEDAAVRRRLLDLAKALDAGSDALAGKPPAPLRRQSSGFFRQ
jgi:transcriptional regulator with XRE-family HTH domain